MDCEATSPASSAEVRHDLGPPGTSSGRDGCTHTVLCGYYDTLHTLLHIYIVRCFISSRHILRAGRLHEQALGGTVRQ